MFKYCLPKTKSIWLLYSVLRLTFCQRSSCSILPKRYQNEPSFGDPQKHNCPWMKLISLPGLCWTKPRTFIYLVIKTTSWLSVAWPQPFIQSLFLCSENKSTLKALQRTARETKCLESLFNIFEIVFRDWNFNDFLSRLKWLFHHELRRDMEERKGTLRSCVPWRNTINVDQRAFFKMTKMIAKHPYSNNSTRFVLDFASKTNQWSGRQYYNIIQTLPVELLEKKRLLSGLLSGLPIVIEICQPPVTQLR